MKRNYSASALGLVATLFLAMATQALGQQPTQLYAFECSPSGCPDGQNPGTLLQASDGNFYGIAQGDGGPSGEGTIFRLTSKGHFKLLYTFLGEEGPGPALVEARDGNLWGVNAAYMGSVYKVSKNGSGFKTVYTFPEIELSATLTVGKDGNLYGSTALGGTGTACGSLGCGTIFTIDVATGVLTTLYSLNGTSDGSNPSGLIQASDGNFYGTTRNNVFRVTPTGTFTVVSYLPAGDNAFGGVIQASNGSLYGMLNDASALPQLFQVALDGSDFVAFPALSSLPHIELLSTLLQASDGNLRLTTFPTAGSGAIVSLSPSTGSIVQNIAFATYATPLIQAKNGNLYGTASGGKVREGTAGGQVFSLKTQ
ncbi:MAG: choice-of-anchor tandem repeat GloVer-containing protein [Terriglobales bacterium]|jgi:uncharacterized repeat protein (TIGR03803 family)